MTEASSPSVKSSMPPLALLAGGLATRMRPMTERVPKSMLEVAGEPFIAHQLRLFRREGISQVMICAGYLAEQIQDFVGDGSRFGLSVEYSLDGEHQLGTGGALRKILPQLGPEFFVTYGDSYLDTPYAPIVQAFRSSHRLALMSVFRNNGLWDVSNVEFSGQHIVAYDKRVRTPSMQFIDYGILVLTKLVLEGYPTDMPFELGDVCNKLASQGQLAGCEVFNRFYEIGSPSGLAETDTYLRGRKD